MRKFVLSADVMPTTGMRHLPDCLTKTAVYNLYKEQMLKQNHPVLAKSTFLYSMWKVKFPDVVIPKVRCLNLTALYIPSTPLYRERIQIVTPNWRSIVH